MLFATWMGYLGADPVTSFARRWFLSDRLLPAWRA
jgi:hypothetical protein